MSGATDMVKDRVREMIGALINDKRLKQERKVDQAMGTVKESIGYTVDKAKEGVKNLTNLVCIDGFEFSWITCLAPIPISPDVDLERTPINQPESKSADQKPR